MGLHIELDRFAVFIHKGLYVLVLQTKYCLIVFLRRRSILEEQHSIPFGNSTTCQHTVNRQGNGFLSLRFAGADGSLDIARFLVFIRVIHAGDVDNLVVVQVLEFVGVASNQCFERIARSTIRQNNNNMATHFAVFNFIIIKESEQFFIFLATVNDFKQFKDFLFMNEQLVASVISSANRFRLKERGESIRHAAITQSCHTLTCGFIRIECKSYHLRKSEIRILPFFLRLVLGEVISIPFLLLTNDVGKLIEGNQILLSIELIAHQDTVGRTRKVNGYINIKLLGAF